MSPDLGTPERAAPHALTTWAAAGLILAVAHPVGSAALAVTSLLTLITAWHPLTWMFFAAVLTQATTLAVVLPPRTLPGIGVRRWEQPELFDLIEAVAFSAGLRTRIRVRLDATPDTGVTMTGWWPRRHLTLVLGWPLVVTLTRGQLSAIIAHEVAHVVHEKPGLRRALAARHRLLARLQRQHQGAGAITATLLHITQPWAHQAEMAADTMAAALVGTQNVREAVTRSDRLIQVVSDIALPWVQEYRSARELPVDLFFAISSVSDHLEIDLPSDPQTQTWSELEHPSSQVRLAALPPAEARTYAADGHPAAHRLSLRQRELWDRRLLVLLMGPEATSYTPVYLIDDGTQGPVISDPDTSDPDTSETAGSEAVDKRAS